MNSEPHLIDRPQRWSEPFGSCMSDADVARLLATEPFRSMDPAAFPRQVSLAGLLANDCRIVEYEAGDVVYRQGDYGNSAFLILTGELSVVLGQTGELFGQVTRPDPVGTLARILGLLKLDKQRDQGSDNASARRPTTRETALGPRMFLQDVPAILAQGETQRLLPGQIFGELSAINRSARSVNVVAAGPATVVEIRWQGLRDLMQRDPALRHHIQQLYRERSLQTHLRETPLLAKLDPVAIGQLAERVEFASFGSMMWTHSWKSAQQNEIAQRILSEPVIAQQGEYCDTLILVRNGFARVTRRHGHGEQTIEYLGKGGVFGLRELVHNHTTGQQRPWQLTLRATGYVDVLKIPADAFQRYVLPSIPDSLRPAPLAPLAGSTDGSGTRRQEKRLPAIPTNMLETIVEQRLMNGTEAMVIDLNRCTRCDDCVRACAATHEGTPRFLRSGLVQDNWMFTQACMHCADPVCMIGCPTGAIARDESSGTVRINQSTCIGCGTCAASCPYSNIEMVSATGANGQPAFDRGTGLPVLKASKCDLCLDTGSGPACQRACPHDALVRMDLSTATALREWTE